jgi:Zn finger protein HypA/HybF involved in hydrogenase expression
MVDMTAIGVISTSRSSLVNITKAMKDGHDATVIQGKVFELQRVILDAQQSVFAANEERTALVERVRDLEAKIANLEAWQTEKQRYELKALSPGSFAYGLKPEAQGSEPMHYICQPCYEQEKRHILQSKAPNLIERQIGGTPSKYVCPACKAEIVASLT